MSRRAECRPRGPGSQRSSLPTRRGHFSFANWVAVGTTVAAVLLLTGRERLHQLAHRVEMKEYYHAWRIPDPDRSGPSATSERTDDDAHQHHSTASLVRIAASSARYPMRVTWLSTTGHPQRAASGWRRSVGSTPPPPRPSSSHVRPAVTSDWRGMRKLGSLLRTGIMYAARRNGRFHRRICP